MTVTAADVSQAGPMLRPGWVLGIRLAGLSLIAVLCLGPLSMPLLRALVPAQQAVFGLLMPEHRLRAFGLGSHGAQLKLGAATTTTGYLVVQSQAVAPGVTFSAETPARVALLHVSLILGGVALLASGAAARLGRAWAGAAAAALFMAVVAPSVTLAGALWGLVVEPFSEPSLAALLVGASEFLLHGGGYALCAAAVWWCVAVGRRRMPRSPG